MENKRDIKNFAITFEDGVITMAENVYDAGIHDKIRLMPDTHVGKGSAIGFTAPLGEKVVPNIVGVDIGCGMTVWNLGKNLTKTLPEINEFISKNVPNGFDKNGIYDKHSSRNEVMRWDEFQSRFIEPLTDELKSSFKKDKGEWFHRQLGSLGSGNHFIEINVDDEGNHYLVIHSGSRGLGIKVNKLWQDKAIANLIKEEIVTRAQVIVALANSIDELTPEKRDEMIKKRVEGIKVKLKQDQKDLASLTGEDKAGYLQDMKVTQEYAIENRRQMGRLIIEFLGIENNEWFDSTHNFIDFRDNIVRKGATSAHKDELAIIPINMRDGSLIVKGKGNEDWNNSAPHGAGRLMSRSVAKKQIDLEDFKETMSNVYSTTVGLDTLDEAPMAYKAMDEIMEAIEPTCDIIKVIKPIMNFKGI